MLRAQLFVAVAGLALGLAACSGITIGGADMDTLYYPEDLAHIGTEERQLRVEVHGNPYASDEFAETVVAAMQGHNGGPIVTFATRPRHEHDGNYRVIVVFNPAPMIFPQARYRQQWQYPAYCGSMPTTAKARIRSTWWSREPMSQRRPTGTASRA